MKKSRSAFLTLVFSLAFAAPAAAECHPLSSAPLDADCVVMSHGSTRGVWFRLDKANELRMVKLEAPELRLQVSKFEQALKLRDEQVELYRGAIAAHKEASADLKKANELLVKQAGDARRDAAEARESAAAWYRSPLFWFGVGVVLTTTAGATTILVLQ